MNPSELLAKVKETSVQARLYGKEAATRHYAGMAGAGRQAAELFYDEVRGLMEPFSVVLNASKEQLDGLLRGKFQPKMTQDEARIGATLAEGGPRFFATATSSPRGDAEKGRYALVLAGIKDAVAIATPLNRLVNPDHPLFVSESAHALYDLGEAADCRASTAILAMQRPQALADPATARASLCAGDKGACALAVFQDVRPEDVSCVIAASEAEADEARAMLATMDRLIPVVSSEEEHEPDPIAPPTLARRPAPQQKYLEAGDRVSSKRTASQAPKLGTVTDVSNGALTVQWDDSTRTTMDMAEAMMRLMQQPRASALKAGMVVYAMPGMDDESLRVLSSIGLDPVSVFAMASHFAPASDKAQGWQQDVMRALEPLGVKAASVKGMAWSDEDGFSSREWIEASLPLNNRLVLDLRPGRIRVVAGSADDYVLPWDEQPRLADD